MMRIRDGATRKWLRLFASNAEGVVLLVGELRSHMPHSAAKNERERDGTDSSEIQEVEKEGRPRGGLGGDKRSLAICHFNGDITDLDEE